MRLAAVVLSSALGLAASILPPVEAATPAESAASANEPESSGHYDQPISAGETHPSQNATYRGVPDDPSTDVGLPSLVEGHLPVEEPPAVADGEGTPRLNAAGTQTGAESSGFPGSNPGPLRSPAARPEMASTCVTFGPRWGQPGRYFSAICMSGVGFFYVKARCYDDDWRYRTTVYGHPAPAPWGISDAYCPFGTHPWTRWVVIL